MIANLYPNSLGMNVFTMFGLILVLNVVAVERIHKEPENHLLLDLFALPVLTLSGIATRPKKNTPGIYRPSDQTSTSKGVAEMGG